MSTSPNQPTSPEQPSMEAKTAPAGHTLNPNDPDSPMGWPLWKKVYTSAASFLFVFVILYGTTTYTTAIPAVPMAFNTSDRNALVAFGLPFFGVFFAPIFTPHLAEKYGRRPIYLTGFSLFTFSVVIIGFAEQISLLLAFRFLAGLFGGPCVVLIEGTFADIWSAQKTVTYYSFLTLASYLGAAFGPIIGGFVLEAQGASWLSWVTLLFALFALAFGGAMPETYGREILRTRIRYNKSGIMLPPAQSGTTIPAMARITVLEPLKMLVSEPVVIMVSLYLGLNFAVVFQWFVAVPFVLNAVYDFSVTRAGLAFLAAVGGVSLAAVTSICLEKLASHKKDSHGMTPIETRLFGAMFGSPLIVGSLFWIGWTASPTTSYLAPIFGTAVYVWGNAMVLISFISYIFDAYPPAGTLSALTAAACFRLACAGIVPIFIKDMIMGLTGMWAYATFGFISLFMLSFPFVLFFTGAHLRSKSRYSDGSMSVVEMEMDARKQGTQTDDMA